jgi:hypothetical protein
MLSFKIDVSVTKARNKQKETFKNSFLPLERHCQKEQDQDSDPDPDQMFTGPDQMSLIRTTDFKKKLETVSRSGGIRIPPFLK